MRKSLVRDAYERIASEQGGMYNRPGSIAERMQNRVLNKVLKLLSNKRGLLLDIGCGTGRYLSTLCQQGFNTIGTDFSLEMLRITSRKGNLANVPLVNGEGTALPFKSNAFDFVLCIDMLHHLPTSQDRGQLLSEISRVLKAGGETILEIKNKSNPFFWFNYSKMNPTPVAEPTTFQEIKTGLKSGHGFLIKRYGIPVSIPQIAPIVVIRAVKI